MGAHVVGGRSAVGSSSTVLLLIDVTLRRVRNQLARLGFGPWPEKRLRVCRHPVGGNAQVS
jgi:hypothetical protein